MTRRSHARRRATLLFVTAVAAPIAATAQATCPRGASAFGDLGVGLFQCVRADCLMAGRNSHDSVHVFNVEPTLWNLAAPGRDIIEEGDALVAIDGRPITTRAAGARLATLKPGDRVVLVLRRASALVEAAVTARASCERPTIQITNSSGGPPDVVTRLALEGVPGSPHVFPSARGSSGGVSPAVLQVLARQMGFAVGTVVDSVATDSPADRAGLQPGDVITGSALVADSAGATTAQVLLLSVRRGDALVRLRIPVPARR